jgi:hypothetical protein
MPVPVQRSSRFGVVFIDLGPEAMAILMNALSRERAWRMRPASGLHEGQPATARFGSW